MKKSKILFADHTPFAGGAQLRLAEDLKFLDRQKIEPILVIDKNSPAESIYEHSQVKIHKIAFPKLNLVHPVALTRLITSVKQFHDFVIKTDPDIVMANTTRTLLVAAVTIKIFGGDFKLISYIRDFEYPKWMMKWLDPEIDKYLFVSKAIQDFYHLPGEVVYLGSDIKTRLAKVKTKQIKDLKQELAVQDQDQVVGYLGRLVDWKGGKELLEAFQKINSQNAKLIFWGAGKRQSGSIESKLKELVKKMNLDQKVVFAGHTNNPEIALKIINFFVLPSQKAEPFATSLVEAAFARLPVVATKVGGTPEFIKDKKNGLLVEAADTNQLSQALLRLIKNPVLADKLAGQIYKDAQKYDQKIFIRRFEKALLT